MTYQYLVNTQMNTTKGIKLHGECAVEALLKEFAQLDNMNTFKLIKADSISKQERKRPSDSSTSSKRNMMAPSKVVPVQTVDRNEVTSVRKTQRHPTVPMKH